MEEGGGMEGKKKYRDRQPLSCGALKKKERVSSRTKRGARGKHSPSSGKEKGKGEKGIPK